MKEILLDRKRWANWKLDGPPANGAWKTPDCTRIGGSGTGQVECGGDVHQAPQAATIASVLTRPKRSIAFDPLATSERTGSAPPLVLHTLAQDPTVINLEPRLDSKQSPL